jgi:hypothetical protein
MCVVKNKKKGDRGVKEEKEEEGGGGGGGRGYSEAHFFASARQKKKKKDRQTQLEEEPNKPMVMATIAGQSQRRRIAWTMQLSSCRATATTNRRAKRESRLQTVTANETNT